ncbi:MAG TPA: DnaA/Hda family protein [Stellaceae bacterium]|nr:DnaA/Hda family protein [Stellaceae bacterium]
MTQLILDLGHRAALGEADFMVAPCNAQAVQWIDRWPNWPAPALTIHGPPGCGKTHLARVFAQRSGAAVIDAAALSSERVPDLLGTGQAAVVDDAERAQSEPLLHLYNELAERRGHLLLTAGEAPARWRDTLADLRSRLAAAPTIAVAPPDDALLAALLLKLFGDRQLTVGEDLLRFLLPRMERSFEAARRLVAALDRAALSEQRAITVPLARAVLDLDQGTK